MKDHVSDSVLSIRDGRKLLVCHDAETDQLVATLDLQGQELLRIVGPRRKFALYADRGEITALIMFADETRGASVMRVTAQGGEAIRDLFEIDVLEEGADVIDFHLRASRAQPTGNS